MKDKKVTHLQANSKEIVPVVQTPVGNNQSKNRNKQIFKGHPTCLFIYLFGMRPPCCKVSGNNVQDSQRRISGCQLPKQKVPHCVVFCFFANFSVGACKQQNKNSFKDLNELILVCITQTTEKHVFGIFRCCWYLCHFRLAEERHEVGGVEVPSG